METVVANYTKKVVLFPQHAAGNCGLYSLANLFNNADFLATMAPDTGQDTFELNTVLRAKWNDVYLSTDYLIPLGMGRVTDPACFSPDDDWTAEGGCMAYIFIVGTGKYLHAIGAVMLATVGREMFVVDSLQREVVRTTPAEFFQQYHVQGILNFRVEHAAKNSPTVSNVALWDINRFSHLIS